MLILLIPLALKLELFLYPWGTWTTQVALYLNNSESEVSLIFGDILQMSLNESSWNADSFDTLGFEIGIIFVPLGYMNNLKKWSTPDFWRSFAIDPKWMWLKCWLFWYPWCWNYFSINKTQATNTNEGNFGFTVCEVDFVDNWPIKFNWPIMLYPAGQL